MRFGADSTLYARQFVVGAEPPEPSAEHFRRHQLAGIPIAVHELCPVSQVMVAGRELLCVGHIVDPEHPALDNQGVLQRLAEQSKSFDQLELASYRFAGRWALFAKIGDTKRLYPDPAGLKAAFYRVTDGGGIQIASQPGLLRGAGVEPDRELIAGLWRSPFAVAWPAAHTPYPGVRQLLPNHYLDLSSGKTRRFWPVRPVPPLGLDEAAQAMRELLVGTFRAVVARGGSVALPLTGGIDSRTLLACAYEVRERLGLFTVVDVTSPFHDVWLPQRLASRMGLKCELVWAGRTEARVIDLLRKNTGELWRDPNEHRAPAFSKIDARYVLIGNVSEVCRCYYYKDGNHPKTIDGAQLAELAGWGRDGVAVAAFEEWLAEFPLGTGINTLDLFYWESRLGNWAALDCMALDTFAETLCPFNCRALLEIGLGADVAHRCEPYQLHRRICEIAAPETLELPINTTWLDSVQKRVQSLVPRSVRTAVRRARRQLAGASS